MFEKEAKDYREKEKNKGYYWVTQEMEQSELDTIVDETFKDGAEFGYNKAKDEMQAQLAISEHDREHNDYELAEVYKKVEQLEKENAELKEQNNKAEDIIRGLYSIIQNRIDYKNNIGIADEMWRAKQFLKE